MSLSIHTNYASLVTQNQIGRTNNMLSSAMERLGTGLRINSAADDAAGLQIANRLEAQTRGIGVAIRNSQDAISMMQTAEGALEELTNISFRMKDLAIQAANGVNGDSEFGALDGEYQELKSEFTRILTQTTYGSGTKLFVGGYTERAAGADPDDPTDDIEAQIMVGGSFGGHTGTGGTLEWSGITFQIGAAASETLNVDIGAKIAALAGAVADVVESDGTTVISGDLAAGSFDATLQTIDSQTNATAEITALDTVLASIGEVRSALGANINRLDHTINNLTSIQENTAAAKGRITDADFALETSNMTKQQMLMQAGMSVLSQSNQMSGLVMSLLR